MVQNKTFINLANRSGTIRKEEEWDQVSMPLPEMLAELAKFPELYHQHTNFLGIKLKSQTYAV